MIWLSKVAWCFPQLEVYGSYTLQWQQEFQSNQLKSLMQPFPPAQQSITGNLNMFLGQNNPFYLLLARQGKTKTSYIYGLTIFKFL